MAKGDGQLRRSQVITTYGPGALIDLPHHSAIVGGLDTWPGDLEQIIEPRLSQKLERLTGVRSPQLFAPPVATNDPSAPTRGITAWRFPEWFVVQERRDNEQAHPGGVETSRRIVHRRALDKKGRFEGLAVVATRFVRACPKGHVDDLDWRRYVHGDAVCTGQLWLDELGTSGGLADLTVRCECKRSRGLYEATILEAKPLGSCKGTRPWLGKTPPEGCGQPARLLIRTASDAYFPQTLSVLSLPEPTRAVEKAVLELWGTLGAVDGPGDLAVFKKLPAVAQKLSRFTDDDILAAIATIKRGDPKERAVKQVELDALLAAPEGFDEGVPIDPNFHARRLPSRIWNPRGEVPEIEAVTQLHRLREVVTLVGFTRISSVTPDIQGEYEQDLERSALAIDPQWFPAVENRGEGIFLQLRTAAVRAWLARPPVQARIDALVAGHNEWAKDRKSKRKFPHGPYVLLHTLSHLLIQSLAMRCGYPASSIRERIFSDGEGERFGLLLFTGSSDAEGTLGGLVQQARETRDHLAHALRAAELCSSDPICAHHEPGLSREGRWLHGAACHACALVAEPSCEMRNDYLDRALVVPVLGTPDAAFFGSPA